MSGRRITKELQKKIDRQARILVETLVKLLGCDGKGETEYYFLSFCRRYASENDDRWHQLHQYFQDKKSAATPSSSSSSI